VLQPLGDGAGQDVEQQALRTLLFDPAAGGGFLPGWPAAFGPFLDRRVAQQQIDDARNGSEVEREEEDAGLRMETLCELATALSAR
jgi:hypothetical protein